MVGIVPSKAERLKVVRPGATRVDVPLSPNPGGVVGTFLQPDLAQYVQTHGTVPPSSRGARDYLKDGQPEGSGACRRLLSAPVLV